MCDNQRNQARPQQDVDSLRHRVSSTRAAAGGAAVHSWLSFATSGWAGPVFIAVTVAGLILSGIAWRKKGARSGIRGIAWSLLPIAAWLTHALFPSSAVSSPRSCSSLALSCSRREFGWASSSSASRPCSSWCRAASRSSAGASATRPLRTSRARAVSRPGSLERAPRQVSDQGRGRGRAGRRPRHTQEARHQLADQRAEYLRQNHRDRPRRHHPRHSLLGRFQLRPQRRRPPVSRDLLGHRG